MVKYAEEWDTEAVKRKYENVLCYLFKVPENKEYIVSILDIRNGEDPIKEFTTDPEITYCVLDEKGVFGKPEKGTLIVENSKHLSEVTHPMIKLRPFSVKPSIVQSKNHKDNVVLFYRTVRKSFKAGVSTENFDVIKITEDKKQEYIDMATVLYPVPFKKTESVQYFKDCIYVLNNDIYVFDRMIGTLIGKIARIKSSVYQKLISEKVPEWQIQSF